MEFPHVKGYSKSCQICQHEHRALIEELYLDWHPIQFILDRFDLAKNDFTAHIRSTKLGDKKLVNQKAVYRQLMESGLASLEEASPDTRAKLAIEAAKHIDKLEGRIVNKTENANPPLLVVTQAPTPDGLLPKPTGQITAGGEVIELEVEDVEAVE